MDGSSCELDSGARVVDHNETLKRSFGFKTLNNEAENKAVIAEIEL